MANIVYGRAAYEGFARAIGLKMGLRVKIADGASPCIDSSGTVMLPGMHTYQTADEFTQTCAAIIHELAHLFYGSHTLIDPSRSRLEHDCLNAVLDVADESCVEHWFAQQGNLRPGALLKASNTHVRDYRPDLFDWSLLDRAAWRILCTGILKARLRRNSRLTKIGNYNARHAHKAGVDAKACYRVLGRAKRTRADNGSPKTSRFKRLVKFAQELADLLKPLAPPESQSPQPFGTGLDAAAGSGAMTVPSGATEATSADGTSIATATSPHGAGGSGAGSNRTTCACEASQNMLRPAVERIAERIATDGDGINLLDGLATGPVLGQAYRLATDGQCLARWQTSEHADGVAVAVILDCSGSMNYHLGQCAGIARAFVRAMRQCGDVLSLVFGGHCKESADDFAEVTDMGGTNTAEALGKAREWLAGGDSAKWIVLVTDGLPDCPNATRRESYAAQADGIRILAVGLDGCASEIRESMPTATVVSASDPMHLAIELEAAAQIIEKG